ncbi:MAG: hypothetical protein D6785_02205 [Planctomycetota bacterium]|nr:MAG: hypothetical protein D6785_02205 [Planctomycetota bacterium]
MAAGKDSFIGKLLGNVEILAKIGQGGMGIVYKGRHTLLNKIVAVKILPYHFSMEEEMRKRFLREAQSAAMLEHPNIVQVLDVGREEDFDYIIMQFVEGESLQDILDRKRILSVKEATNIVYQTLEGLDFAHRKGIIHRDIKPDNLMITFDGVVKIADFGLARNIQDASLTGTGHIVGTPHFMAPEQASGKNMDRRCDIYSLGITYYTMVTGHIPFEEETPIAIMTKKLTHQIVPPHRINPNVPKPVSQIIEKMIATDPNHRYQSCSDVKRAIENSGINYETRLSSLATLGATDEYPTLASPATFYENSTLVDRLGGKSVIFILGFSLFILLILGGGYLIYRKSNNDLIRKKILQAKLALQQGDLDRAQTLFSQAYEKSLTPMEQKEIEKKIRIIYLLKKGNRWITEKKWKEAQKEFQKALALDPSLDYARRKLEKIQQVLAKPPSHPTHPIHSHKKPLELVLGKIPSLVRQTKVSLPIQVKGEGQVYAYLNGKLVGKFDPSKKNFLLNGLKPGSYKLRIVLKGKKEKKEGLLSFTVDLTPPGIEIHRLPQFSRQKKILLEGRVVPYKKGDHLHLYFEGKEVPLKEKGYFQIHVNLIKEGWNKFELEAKDSYGNSVKKEISVFLDQKAPRILLPALPKPWVQKKDMAELEGLKVEDQIRFEISLFTKDEKSPIFSWLSKPKQEPPILVLPLKEGKNIFYLMARDFAGNRSLKKLIIYRVPKGMVYIPAGNISDSNKTYSVPKGYFISLCEVSIGEYLEYLKAKNLTIPKDWRSDKIMSRRYSNPKYHHYPAAFLNYQEARNFCIWKRGDLPTEAEWIKAAYFNPTTKKLQLFPWGDHFDSKKANFESQDVVPVDTMEGGRSPWGCFHMAGNVSEWVREIQGEKGLIKGGSYTDKPKKGRRDAPPIMENLKARYAHIGFRYVIEIKE